MTRIRWTTGASDQLEAIVRRIREENPEAARAVAQAILDRIARLETFPGMGRPGEKKAPASWCHRLTSSSAVSRATLPKSSTSGMARRTGVKLHATASNLLAQQSFQKKLVHQRKFFYQLKSLLIAIMDNPGAKTEAESRATYKQRTKSFQTRRIVPRHHFGMKWNETAVCRFVSN